MKPVVNQLHYFEIMDRCLTSATFIEERLVKHPAMSKRMKLKIEKAQELICEVYQWSGTKFRDFEGNEK